MVLTILWLFTQPAITLGFDVKFAYEQSVTVTAGGFVVTIESASFQPERHKITRDRAGWIELEDNTRLGVLGGAAAGATMRQSSPIACV